MASYGPGCTECGSRDCPGCADPHPMEDAREARRCAGCGQYYSHLVYWDASIGQVNKQTHCKACGGRPVPPWGSSDWRDLTPPPPVHLDPGSVLRNRECTRKLLATGDLTWPRGEDWVRGVA